MKQSALRKKVFLGAKCAKELNVLGSKVCPGIECVEEQSELGSKVYQATLK